MQIKILAFGVAKDIVGTRQLDFAIFNGITVETLRKTLHTQYPALEKLTSMAIAVNGEYASDEVAIAPGDEVVLIPPVSGG
ncbi:MAG: MoaD/ThiS family protein [Saprospiraceae bacterium]|nr:MoaD/ThiS family protein [Saprospiraceae bacterium]